MDAYLQPKAEKDIWEIEKYCQDRQMFKLRFLWLFFMCVCVLDLYWKLLVCVYVWWYMSFMPGLRLSPGYSWGEV